MSMVKRIRCGNVNAYIVSEGDAAILADTGRREYLDAVIDACKPYKIKLIVLTHAHFDHAENAAALSERFEVPIAMHKDDVDLIESNNNQSMSARTFPGKIVLSASVYGFSKRKMKAFTPSVFLNDGDELTRYKKTGSRTHKKLPGNRIPGSFHAFAISKSVNQNTGTTAPAYFSSMNFLTSSL